MTKPVAEIIDEIWKTDSPLTKQEHDLRKAKTIQQLRWMIGDILVEFKKSQEEGLALAKRLLEE